VLGIVAVAARQLLGTGDRGAGELFGALDYIPAAVVERGLYASSEDGLFDSGFGLAPGRVDAALEEAYGISGDQVTAVVESGAPPITVLVGRFDVEEVAAKFVNAGYERTTEQGWTVLRAGADAGGPLAAGVPMVALREDAIALGGDDDITALLTGPAAAATQWVPRVLAAVDGETTALALGPARVTDDPASASPQGWLLALQAADGERRAGQIAVAFTGDAGPAAAGTLASAVRTSGPVGAGAQTLAFEAAEPTWDADAAVALVGVTAAGSDDAWAQLRTTLEAGNVPFLP
jgi:hypothetical protein